MRFQLKPTWEVLHGEPSPQTPWVELLTHQELLQRMDSLNGPSLERSLRHTRNCKAELLDHCAAGTLLIPHKERLLSPGASFAFCLTQDCLYFADDTGEVEKLLQRLSQQPGLESNPSGLFLEFLELLIQEDAPFLQRLESHLDELEEQLLAQKEAPHFENQLHRYRRGLLKLSAYYAQLDELGDTLASNRNGLFSKKACRGFELFSRRASRLHSQTASLRGVLPAASPDLPIQDRLETEPGHAISHGGYHDFLAIDPNYWLVRHELHPHAGTGPSPGPTRR